MTLSAQIKWVTNLADFKSQIEAGTSGVVAHTATVDRLTRSMGGQGLLAAANNTAAAIEKLGGVSKLTGAEQQRVNTLLEKAIEKYAALGQTAPQALQDLANATKKVDDHTEGLGGRIKGFASTHAESFRAVGAAAGMLVGAIGAVAAAVVVLGKRGAEVSDVTSAFDRLNAVAGQDGPTALAALRRGVGGLLTDYDLMKGITPALSAGLKLNAADAYAMSRAAWVLADAQGKDLKESYSTIAAAIATGKVAGLAALGVSVEQKGTALQLKAALDAEGSAMSSAATIGAKRQAAMEALNRVVLEAGDQELDFAEKLTRARVQVTNMTDSLGVAIATSPVVGTAMNFIGDAMQSAFGANQTDTIKTIVGWINKAAIVAVDFAQVGVAGAGVLGQAWSGLQLVFSGVMSIVSLVGLGFAKLVEGAALKIPGVGDKFRGLAGEARGLSDFMGGVQKSFHDQAAEALEGVKGNNAFSQTMGALGGKLGEMKARMIAASDQQVTSGVIAKGLADRHQELADSTTKSTAATLKHAEAIKKQADGYAGLTVIATAKDALEAYHVNVARGIPLSAMHTDQLKKFNAEVSAGLEVQRARGLALDREQLSLKFLSGVLLEQLPLLNKHKDVLIAAGDAYIPLIKARADAFPTSIPGLDNLILQTGKIIDADAEAAKAAQAHAREVDMLLDSFLQLGNTIGGVTGKMVSGLGQIGAAFLQAKQANASYNGGVNAGFGVANAMLDSHASSTARVASAAQSGAAIASGAMNIWAATSGNATKSANTLHGAVAGAKAGAAFGPYGMAVGAAAGAVVGFVRAMDAGRDAVKNFGKDFGGLDELHKRLGILGESGEKLWIKLTQGVDKGNPKAAAAAIDEVKKALEGSDAALNKMIGTALTGGPRLSASMQPFIEDLIKSGKLTEDNANLLLGLPAKGVPAINDIKAAAERYGLTLDQLGAKVDQLRINEQAAQIVSDFELLTRAGVPFDVLMRDITVDVKDAAGNVTQATTGMHHDIQEMVNKSLGPLGVELPEAMRPMLQQMLDAGLLTDATGKTLIDLSGIKFTEPIERSVQRLIDKMGELIDKFDAINGRKVVTTITTRHEREGAPADFDPTNAEPVASGGLVGRGTPTSR